MINLIEVLRGTGKKEVFLVYAMHLMELSERSSAILIVHKVRKNGLPFWKKDPKSGSDQIVVAFEAFQQLSKVSIWPTTAISAVSSMHEDICNGAECNRAAMIILPFHKHLRLDGQLETTRGEHVNCLEHAPCSVGILVDRGFGGTSHITASNVNSLVTVLFFGGNDDHEELAYGARMAEHPGINLIVVRFLLNPVGPVTPPESITVKIHEPTSDTLIQSTDDEVIADFKKTALSKSDTMKYDERVVKNGAEKIDIIREYARSNLFLVGRMPEGEVLEFLNKKNECPDMGPVGNLLNLL
ncbi:hypothetical protein Tco_0669149 [Tanacetum coccineum]